MTMKKVTDSKFKKWKCIFHLKSVRLHTINPVWRPFHISDGTWWSTRSRAGDPGVRGASDSPVAASSRLLSTQNNMNPWTDSTQRVTWVCCLLILQVGQFAADLTLKQLDYKKKRLQRCQIQHLWTILHQQHPFKRKTSASCSYMRE